MYAEYKKIFGNTYCNQYKDYLCLMPNGELMKPGYLSHTFAKLLEDNKTLNNLYEDMEGLKEI